MSDESQAVSLRVDGRQLADLLARVAQQGRQLADSPAVFHLEPASLTVEWAGASERLAAEADGEVCVRVPLTVVIGLSRMLGSGQVTVTVQGERIRVGRIGFGCERVARRPPQLIGTDAGPFAVLLAGYREDPARIDEAGLTGEVARMRARVASSVKRAVEHLAWVEVDEQTLADWVEAHLRQLAKRTP